MKRILLLLLLCLYTVCAEAQISYSSVHIRRSDSFVEISFEVTSGAKGVRRGEQLLLTPVLYNKSRSVTLPSVAVQSKIAQWQEFRAGKGPGSPDAPAFVIRNREQVVYNTRIPDDKALRNVFLRIERSVVRGEDTYPLSTIQLTRKPLLVSRKVYTLHYGLPAVCPSVADSLAARYPFVTPLSEFERTRKGSGETLLELDTSLNMGKGVSEPHRRAVERFVADNEKGALRIYFSRYGSAIDRHYKENNASLVALASVLNRIQRSDNALIDKVVVAGFSSPDGPLEENDRLARARVYAVREFIRNTIPIAPEKILLYNGSEDWREQRNAAYIKVYYTNTRQTAPSENVRQAVARMDKGEYQAALTLLAGEPETEDGVLENLTGVCYMMTGDATRSAACFRQAIAKGNTDAPLNLEQHDSSTN